MEESGEDRAVAGGGLETGEPSGNGASITARAMGESATWWHGFARFSEPAWVSTGAKNPNREGGTAVIFRLARC